MWIYGIYWKYVFSGFTEFTKNLEKKFVEEIINLKQVPLRGTAGDDNRGKYILRELIL